MSLFPFLLKLTEKAMGRIIIAVKAAIKNTAAAASVNGFPDISKKGISISESPYTAQYLKYISGNQEITAHISIIKVFLAFPKAVTFLSPFSIKPPPAYTFNFCIYAMLLTSVYI